MSARRVMAGLTTLILTVPVLVRTQTLLPKNPVQYARITPGGVVSATAGSTVTLWVDVVPNRAIHIYAKGARDVTPVSLVTTATGAIVAGTVKYPKAKEEAVGGVLEPVPVYSAPFRIEQPITLGSATSGETVTIAAVLKYQACDDRLCYPETAAPVSWTVAVK